MTPPHVVVVGCGFPQLALLRRGRALGLRVTGADMNPQAVGVPLCHDFAQVSTGDPDAVAALVTRVGATAVTTTGSELALTTTAKVAHRLGLPFYADPETVRRCQEKDAMRAGYAKGGVKVPAFAPCETLEEARRFIATHGYPVVVKPSRGWGQRGVARVDGDGELAVAFEGAMGQSRSAGLAMVVVEAWLEGKEYSVNGWVEEGRLVSYCVTERLTVPGKRPLGVMVAEVYPSGLASDEEAKVVDEARRGAAALGLTRGPCYSQVVFGRGGAYLFETAARLGGGFDADVTLLASGVDLTTRVLGVAAGRADWEAQGLRERGTRHGGAIAKFLLGKPGVVTAIQGLDEARALPGVVDVEVFVPVGGRVFPLTDSAKRAGYVLAHGRDGAEAHARADAALSRIRLVTEEAS